MASSSKASQMASAAAVLVVVVFLLTAEAPRTEAKIDEKACMSSVVSLLPCLPFTENTAPKPSDACCRNIAQVLQNQPICLCAVLDGEASQWLGVKVNLTTALTLPPACKVETPPPSTCNSTAALALEGPVAGPQATPSGGGLPNVVHSGAVLITKSNLFFSCMVAGLLLALSYLAGF